MEKERRRSATVRQDSKRLSRNPTRTSVFSDLPDEVFSETIPSSEMESGVSRRLERKGTGASIGVGAMGRDAEVFKSTLTEPGFRTLERQFQENLAELEAVPTLSRYREAFEKLFNSFRNSYTNEANLVSAGLELHNRLSSTKQKLEHAHCIIDEHEGTIANYKRELQKALEEVHRAKAQKKDAEEKIRAFNGEISRLGAAVDEATDRGNRAEEELEQKEIELREIHLTAEELRHKLSAMEEQLSSSQQEECRLAEKLTEVTARATVLEEEMKNKDDQVGQESRRRTIAEREAESILEQKTQWLQEREELLKLVDQEKQINENLHQELKHAAHNYKELQLKLDSLEQEIQSLERENEAKGQAMAEMTTELNEAQAEIKVGRKNLRKLQEELRISDSRKQKLDREVSKQMGLVEDHRKQKNELAKTLKEKESIIKDLSNQAESLRKAKCMVNREKTLLQSNGISMSRQLAESGRQNEDLQKEVARLKKVLSGLEKDKGNVEREIKASKKEQEHLLEEKQALKSSLNEALRKLNDEERKVETERKKGMTAEDELRTLRLKLGEVVTQKNRIGKEEEKKDEEKRISENRNSLLHVTTNRLSAAVDSLEKELSSCKQKQEELKTRNKKLEQELANLSKEKREMEATLGKAMSENASSDKKLSELSSVADEKVKETEKLRKERNDELSALERKLEAYASSLTQGQKVLEDKDNKEHTLQQELERALKTVASLRSELKEREKREECFRRLEKVLTLEKQKVRALEAEVRKPHVMHRWRKLEAKDPTRFELIMKQHYLQRRNIQLLKGRSRQQHHKRLGLGRIE